MRKLSSGLEIVTNCEAVYVVTTRGGRAFHARRVCVGVTSDVLRALFPRVPAYRRIASQPFVRVYARLNAPLP